jgi:hypothetical protein
MKPLGIAIVSVFYWLAALWLILLSAGGDCAAMPDPNDCSSQTREFSIWMVAAVAIYLPAVWFAWRARPQ